MSGGCFLISAKDVSFSENILKIQSLVKEGFNIDSSLKVNEKFEEATEKLLNDVSNDLNDVNWIQLDVELDVENIRQRDLLHCP